MNSGTALRSQQSCYEELMYPICACDWSDIQDGGIAHNDKGAAMMVILCCPEALRAFSVNVKEDIDVKEFLAKYNKPHDPLSTIFVNTGSWKENENIVRNFLIAKKM